MFTPSDSQYQSIVKQQWNRASDQSFTEVVRWMLKFHGQISALFISVVKTTPTPDGAIPEVITRLLQLDSRLDCNTPVAIKGERPNWNLKRGLRGCHLRNRCR